MDIAPLVDQIGTPSTAALLGLLTGLIFGVAAQRSSFCLRASVVEFTKGQLGKRMAVWLLAFSTALVWTQSAALFGLMRVEEARMMAVPGSLSGAIVGGLLFGSGMVLARGCSGRLLVLAATGNLRAIVSGLVFAIVAQMSLRGWLAPLRNWIAELWITPGGRNINFLTMLHLPQVSGLVIGIAFAVTALWLAHRNQVSKRVLFTASGVGFAVASGWVLTYSLSLVSFDPVQVESATFTGPSANTLMFFLTANPVLEFDIGLVPGVFLGAFLAAAWGRELKWQGFEGAGNMRMALAGAAMMGMGGMLAGGCAIGAGVTGGSIFVFTAWLALFCMWLGGMATAWLLSRRSDAAVA